MTNQVIANQVEEDKRVRDLIDDVKKAFGHIQEQNDLDLQSKLASLEGAITALHADGYVFGDLREPNVLLVGDKVVLVDFDWCGKEGEVRYPSDILLEKAQWHPDVMQGGLIMQEHDSFQFYHLTGTEFYVTEPVE